MVDQLKRGPNGPVYSCDISRASRLISASVVYRVGAGEVPAITGPEDSRWQGAETLLQDTTG